MDHFERHPFRQLLFIFCAWKSLLLLLAAFCPGPGYDTSALILLDPAISRHQTFQDLPRYDRLILNLLRWDSIYFSKTAQRGHMLEQEWAFSSAYSNLLHWTVEGKTPSHRYSQLFIQDQLSPRTTIDRYSTMSWLGLSSLMFSISSRCSSCIVFQTSYSFRKDNAILLLLHLSYIF